MSVRLCVCASESETRSRVPERCALGFTASHAGTDGGDCRESKSRRSRAGWDPNPQICVQREREREREKGGGGRERGERERERERETKASLGLRDRMHSRSTTNEGTASSLLSLYLSLSLSLSVLSTSSHTQGVCTCGVTGASERARSTERCAAPNGAAHCGAPHPPVFGQRLVSEDAAEVGHDVVRLRAHH